MHHKGFYNNLSETDIKKRIKKDGFDPVKFENDENDIYRAHKHPETKLLAFLKGDMCVTIDERHYFCEAGDRLIIPGNIEHSAKVGNKGCTFFWSEKLL